MQNDADVLGCEDINDLLRKHRHVEKSHFKLWLHSTEVLATFANAAILGRSAFTLREIQERSSAYVRTASHSLAMEKVNKLGVLLITGEPGIGKTTLAEQLCLDYVVNGYQLCVAARQIEELENLYQEDTKQIFYFDDFLGSNFLAVLDRHEDAHIVGFIRRVSKDKTKRFILTSRSTVLNRGKALTDRFRNERIEKNEFEIEVKSLTEIDKARILHSRMWFSGLPRKYMEVIIDKKRYWIIIQHPNFNPRLISFITDFSRFNGVIPSDYWSYIEATLKNPIDVWDHVFNSQLTDWSRLIVLLVVFAGGIINERRLLRCYEILSSDALVRNYAGDADFEVGMRVLVGSVLNRRVERSDQIITLFNPSIADYVLRKTSNSVKKLFSLMAVLSDLHSLNNFEKLRLNGIVESDIYVEVIGSLYKTKLTVGSVHPDSVFYLAKLCELAVQYCDVINYPISEIDNFVQAVSEMPECSTYIPAISPLLIYELENKLISNEVLCKLLDYFDASDFDREELTAVSKVFPLLPTIFKSKFESTLKSAVVEYWQNFLVEEIVEMDILGDILDFENISEANRIIKEEVCRLLGEYNIYFTQTDYEDVLKYVDVHDIINGNIKRSMHDGGDGDRGYADRGAVEIDDLFSFDFP